jgi:hypothetical protein
MAVKFHAAFVICSPQDIALHFESRIGRRAEARPLQRLVTGLMSETISITCDGCGQRASAGHIAQRLQRLEWATRYRPVHIHTLLLGGVSPLDEHEFLYSPKGEFRGEAARVFSAAGISLAGKDADAVHTEFQRGGFFLTHVLECPFEELSGDTKELMPLLARRLSGGATRIRRSLKPKRVVLFSRTLEPLLDQIMSLSLGCPVVLDGGRPFELEDRDGEKAAARLREALAAAVTG